MKNPSVLAFERKIDPSDALMYAVTWDSRTEETALPVGIREKSVRGTISNRRKAGESDPAKLDAAIQSPNLQTVDVAMLPAEKDSLKLCFSVRVLGGVGRPSACNDAEYAEKLLQLTQAYSAETGFTELSRRYACNLANGRFLWRNRASSEDIEVRVRQMEHGQPVQTWIFDASAFSLQNFDDIPSASGIATLAAVIAKALTAVNGYALLEVTAYARMGLGQEVYPSQELILDKAKNKKSKTLYQIEGIAAMHSQKVGNALRAVDTWYPEASAGPLALEPYASVTSQGKAYRVPKEKQDFYSLLDGWLLKDKEPALEQRHFVMGILIRGGVFGESEKE